MTGEFDSHLYHPGLPLDDAAGAWREIAANWRLQTTTAASIASIAAFNFAGINVSAPAVTALAVQLELSPASAC